MTKIPSEHIYEVRGMEDWKFTVHVQRMKYYVSISSVMEKEEVLDPFMNSDRTEVEVSNFAEGMKTQTSMSCS